MDSINDGSASKQAPPCIHTVETGKHEWNSLHSVHQANDRFWFKQCPTCGWIDTEDFAKQVRHTFALPTDDDANDWRLVKAGEVGPKQGGHGSWVETDHPAVVACMGSVPQCAENGCQYRKAVRETRQWQPIETAPKDLSVPIIAFAPGYIEPVIPVSWDDEIEAEGGQCWRVADAVSDRVAPTHWQPMPPPPLAASLQAGVPPTYNGGEMTENNQTPSAPEEPKRVEPRSASARQEEAPLILQEWWQWCNAHPHALDTVAKRPAAVIDFLWEALRNASSGTTTRQS